MKVLHVMIGSVGLIVGTVGLARADDTPMDPAAYKQKMHDCVTQMKTDHPDMNHAARRKACHKQLGPAPKMHSSMSSPAKTPAPAGTNP